VGLSVNWCAILMRIFKLGCWALSEIAFESNSVRRQVGYLTPPRHTVLLGSPLPLPFFTRSTVPNGSSTTTPERCTYLFGNNYWSTTVSERRSGDLHYLRTNILLALSRIFIYLYSIRLTL